MHEDIIQSLSYEAGTHSSRFGFHFLQPSRQAWLKKSIALCFESDVLFSRCNKAYRGLNHETRATTLWHRETAETFSHGAIWQTLQDKARDDEARQRVARKHEHFQAHAWFSHHTLESLVYGGKAVLPSLQRALKKAQTSVQRWSWLPWLPNRFLVSYRQYLRQCHATLSHVETALIAAIELRVQQALFSPTLSCDVLLDLIHALRFDVPGFLPDARLAQDAIPGTFQELLSGEKRLALPQTVRCATFTDLQNAMDYLRQKTPATHALNALCDTALRTFEAPLALRHVQHRGQGVFFPRAWVFLEKKKRKAHVKPYPWHRHWNAECGLRLFQAEDAILVLRGVKAPGSQVSALTNSHVITMSPLSLTLDFMQNLMASEKALIRYHDTLKRYRPKSIKYWFLNWKKTRHYRAYEAQRKSIEAQLTYTHHAKVDWLMKNQDVFQQDNALTLSDWSRLLPMVENTLLTQTTRAVQDPARLQALYAQYYALQVLILIRFRRDFCSPLC